MGLLFAVPILLSLLALRSSQAYVESSGPAKNWRASLGLGKEKLTHLHFYFHDRRGGKNATVVTVGAAPSMGHPPAMFGGPMMVDNPLTDGPDPSSKEVGRAQGMYGTIGREETKLLMVTSLSFTTGKFKGGSLSMLCQNPITHLVQELAIVGGTGSFRLARGVALVKTVDSSGLSVTVEYHVKVIH